MESSSKAVEEAAATEVAKKESISDLEKYFKSMAEMHRLDKKLVKKESSVFGKALQESAIGKELEKLVISPEAKLAIINLIKERILFETYLKKASLPYLLKEKLGNKAGLGYLFPDQFALDPFLGKGMVGLEEEHILFNEMALLSKLDGMGLSYFPLKSKQSLGSLIPLKTAMDMKDLGKRQLLKGIALDPKSNLAYVPIF
ncbi:hypothetical protein JTE90_008072 [Oedothorax gibbosus]|uniref:Uncharacterized protein n=1 Tax=Oedothorax gibbosus TaxID=931172 RepID=A0AAV6UXG3_9ARAC|nr:hypothetical protein JTE90_008072 [Oedothorax gibbosus]